MKVKNHMINYVNSVALCMVLLSGLVEDPVLCWISFLVSKKGLNSHVPFAMCWFCWLMVHGFNIGQGTC